MPVFNVESYLSECLDSVLGQSLRHLEVIVVDDGSTDSSPAIIAKYAARDRRVRTFRQDNAGQGPARNLGVSHARGQFLAFLDADDTVPRDGYRHMIDVLQRSGSDFAVGAAQRMTNGTQYRPSWNVLVHDRDRIGMAIDDFPTALADVIACNRLLRRSFWQEHIQGFEGGILYEDHVPMVAAYVRAARFDLLKRVTYNWRLRDDGTSTGQQKHVLRNLTDRIKVKAEGLALVRAEASEVVQAAWIARVLDIDLAAYIDHALVADPAYRAVLSEAIGTYQALATPTAMSFIRVRQKVRAYLASRGDWERVGAANQLFRNLGSIPPTTIVDGRVRLTDDFAIALGVELPAETLELSAGETRLQACALGTEWIGDSSLRLTGWALIRSVDLADREPALELWIESHAGRIDLDVEPVSLPEATRWVGWPHGSFDRAGFRTVIDVARPELAREAVTEWTLRVRVTVSGLAGEDGMHHAAKGFAPTERRVTARGLVVASRLDPERGLTFRIRRPG